MGVVTTKQYVDDGNGEVIADPNAAGVVLVTVDVNGDGTDENPSLRKTLVFGPDTGKTFLSKIPEGSTRKIPTKAAAAAAE